MSDRNYLKNSRWDWAYLVECKTCGWYNLSQDYEYTKHAGMVHTKMLKIDHRLQSISPERIEHDDSHS